MARYFMLLFILLLQQNLFAVNSAKVNSGSTPHFTPNQGQWDNSILFQGKARKDVFFVQKDKLMFPYRKNSKGAQYPPPLVAAHRGLSLCH